MSPEVIRTPGAAALVRMTAFSTGLVVDWPHKEKALVRKVAHTARLVRCRTPIFIFLPAKPVLGLVMSTPAPRRVSVNSYFEQLSRTRISCGAWWRHRIACGF